MKIFAFLRLRRQRKSARLTADHLGKYLRYERDRLPVASRETLQGLKQRLRALQSKGSGEEIEAAIAAVEETVPRLITPRQFAGLREQVEMIFVAVVAALAIRAYFYQPFKIPTDSMKPTLYGVQSVHREERAMPSLPVRIVEGVVFGRSYHQLALEKPGHLIRVHTGSFTPWVEYTDLVFDNGETHRVWTNYAAVEKQGLVPFQKKYPAGEPILNFYTEAGDHVLVDKWSYHFRAAEVGQPFVFRTTNIAGIEQGLRAQGIEGSQYYIKRCVGTPGDTLRIVPPYLEVNGGHRHLPEGMQRVMRAAEGYRGYSIEQGQHFLRSPNESFKLPSHAYWAMGDNSPNSSDSRFWGIVPKANLVGVASCVWWPFGKRWGGIE